jgi:hypothetical protein
VITSRRSLLAAFGLALPVAVLAASDASATTTGTDTLHKPNAHHHRMASHHPGTHHAVASHKAHTAHSALAHRTTQKTKTI